MADVVNMVCVKALGAFVGAARAIAQQFPWAVFHCHPSAIIGLQELGRGAHGRVIDAVVAIDAHKFLHGALKLASEDVSEYLLTRELQAAADLGDLPEMTQVLAWAPNARGTAVAAILFKKQPETLLANINARREQRKIANPDAPLPTAASPLYTSDEYWPFILNLITFMIVMHARGIYHCDIKPDNILIDENGHPVFSDFGLVWYEQRDGAVIKGPRGTDGFCLPALSAGDSAPVDFSIDLQPLALTIIYMLLLIEPEPARELHKHGKLAQFLPNDIPLRTLILSALQSNAALRMPPAKWIERSPEKFRTAMPDLSLLAPPADPHPDQTSQHAQQAQPTQSPKPSQLTQSSSSSQMDMLAELPATPPHSVMRADSTATSADPAAASPPASSSGGSEDASMHEGAAVGQSTAPDVSVVEPSAVSNSSGADAASPPASSGGSSADALMLEGTAGNQSTATDVTAVELSAASSSYDPTAATPTASRRSDDASRLEGSVATLSAATDMTGVDESSAPSSTASSGGSSEGPYRMEESARNLSAATDMTGVDDRESSSAARSTASGSGVMELPCPPTALPTTSHPASTAQESASGRSIAAESPVATSRTARTLASTPAGSAVGSEAASGCGDEEPQQAASADPDAAAVYVNPCFATAGTGGDDQTTPDDDVASVVSRLASLPRVHTRCLRGEQLRGEGQPGSQCETPTVEYSDALTLQLTSPQRAQHGTLDSELGMSGSLPLSPYKAHRGVDPQLLKALSPDLCPAAIGRGDVPAVRQETGRWSVRGLRKALRTRFGCLAAPQVLE